MRQIQVLLGHTGSGKSYRLRKLIDGSPRVVIYDSLGDPSFDAYRRMASFPELCRFLITDPAIFRVAYQWPGDVPQEADFDRVCEAVYACRSVVLVCEEVALFCNPNLIPIPLRKIVALGRHRELSFFCTSQTPPQVHSLIRSQAHAIVSFNQTEPNHVSWCRVVMGEGADLLPRLPPYWSVEWSRGAGSRLRDPSWTVKETFETPLDSPLVSEGQS